MTPRIEALQTALIKLRESPDPDVAGQQADLVCEVISALEIVEQLKDRKTDMVLKVTFCKDESIDYRLSRPAIDDTESKGWLTTVDADIIDVLLGIEWEE